MTKNTKIRNNDNGMVDMTEEAVLSGVSPCEPEKICTKYPENCTDLMVSPTDCPTECCDTAPTTQGL